MSAPLVYGAITSLDGFVNDADGRFEWAAPDEEVHAFVNDLERPTGTYWYGRRMWDTMRVWGHDAAWIDESPVTQDYASIWRSADKVVFSRTLARLEAPRTRLETGFDPATAAAWKREADEPIGVGSATLAAAALTAGLVDELWSITVPVVVGAGTRWLPHGVALGLELTGHRRFAAGAVWSRYRVRR